MRDEPEPSAYERHRALRRRVRIREAIIIAVVLAGVIALGIARREHFAPSAMTAVHAGQGR